MSERVQYDELHVAKELDDLLVEEILPGLNITPDEFWTSFNKIVKNFSQKNKSLITEREKLQKKLIDGIWTERDKNIIIKSTNLF